MAELTVEQMEQYVRTAWVNVMYSESGLTLAGPFYVVISATDHPTAGSTIFMQHGGSKESVWQSAYAFTIAREDEIAALGKGITFLEEDLCDAVVPCVKCAAIRPLIARLQAIKAELQRGMSAQTKEATDAK